MSPKDPAVIRGRLARLAWLLDSSIRLPGLRTRVGWDAVIGLVPGVGDAIGVALSAWIVAQARQAGVPPSVIARMIGNIAVEAVIGLVPILGDVFDAGFKANVRNVRLLDRWLATTRRDLPYA